MDHKTEPELPLEGVRVLIAEDEFLIAGPIEEALREAGADTSHAATVRAALLDIDYALPSVALLDVRLGLQTSEEVADSLAAHHVPFVFYSGADLPEELRGKHPDAEVLHKPVAPRTIVDTVVKIAR